MSIMGMTKADSNLVIPPISKEDMNRAIDILTSIKLSPFDRDERLKLMQNDRTTRSEES